MSKDSRCPGKQLTLCPVTQQERYCGDSPVLWPGLVADLSQRDFKTNLCSHLAGDIKHFVGFVLSACLLLLSCYKNADTHS